MPTQDASSEGERFIGVKTGGTAPKVENNKLENIKLENNKMDLNCRENYADRATQEQRDSFNIVKFIKRHSKVLTSNDLEKYPIHEVHIMLDLVLAIFQKQNALIEVRAPINICGDTHGQLNDVQRIFRACGSPVKSRYLFLGDYIGRGKNSLEVIALLFAYKVLLPNQIHLLRGNHELKAINKNYGFHDEMRTRFKVTGSEQGIDLWNHFNHVFSYMPLAAVVSKRILCMHGGISPHLNSLDDIRAIPLPLETAKQNPLACDLLWADPEKGCVGFEPNKIRAIAHIFGENEVNATCARLNIDLIIRAHQVVEYGFSFFANRRLITVFSAARYQEELMNYAGIVVVGARMDLSFMQLKPEDFTHRREEIEKGGATVGFEQPTAKG